MAKQWLFDLVHWPHGTEPDDYDAAQAAEEYERHLAEWAHAEELGFDGVFLGEHHFTPYSLTPSPNLMIAAAAQRTKTMRLGIMINVLPFHQPFRLAEEIAMLDLLTGGRLECGLGRGVDAAEFSRLNISMDDARPRFEEGLELMLKAWTQSTFSHHSEHYSVNEATLYPRPIQRPHPPIWITALSQRSIEWAAERNYPMASMFLPTQEIAKAFAGYRKHGESRGQVVTPANFLLCRNVYVADSEEEARAHAEPAFNRLFGLLQEAAFLPDTTIDESYASDDYAFWREFFRPFVGSGMSFDDLCNAGIMILGTPDQVREQVVAQVQESGCGNFMAWMCFGDLSAEQVRKSEELYAEHVLPAVAEINADHVLSA